MADGAAPTRPADVWRIARQRRDASYLDRLGGVTYRPVFVLGEHRSGTTILYELLALSGSFNYLTAYHTLYFDQLLANHVRGTTEQAREDLNARLRSLGVSTRLVDAIEFNADYPEEYCFFLQAHSHSFRLSRRNLPAFDRLCRKVQYTGDADRRLLLKNPFDFTNFLTIKRLVPDACFVFIHRHPLTTLSSMLQMVRRNWSSGNVINQLYSRAYARLQGSAAFSGLMQWVLRPDSTLQLGRRLMARRIAQHARYYVRHIAELPESDYVSLRYEDLCRDPRAEMERVFRFLGETPRHAVDYETRIRPRGLELPPELKRVETALCRRFETAMAYHGYGRESTSPR
jgi:Sulfotransferase family